MPHRFCSHVFTLIKSYPLFIYCSKHFFYCDWSTIILIINRIRQSLVLNNDEKSTEPAEKFFHIDEIQRHKNILREKKTQRVYTFISIHYFVWVAFSHSRLNHVFGLVWIVYGFFTEFLRSQLITFFCFIVKIWNIAV